jgi:hypothetical protein
MRHHYLQVIGSNWEPYHHAYSDKCKDFFPPKFYLFSSLLRDCMADARIFLCSMARLQTLEFADHEKRPNVSSPLGNCPSASLGP